MWHLGIFHLLAGDQNVLNMAPYTVPWLGENLLGLFGVWVLGWHFLFCFVCFGFLGFFGGFLCVYVV